MGDTSMSNIKGWAFNRMADGRRWSYADPESGVEQKQSSQGFETILECINDATRNGYERPGVNRSDQGDAPLSNDSVSFVEGQSHRL